MTQASGSNAKLHFIKEVTFGTTPATPTMQDIEYVSFDGALDAPTLTDASLSSTRQVKSARRGNPSTKGKLDIVMCPDNIDWALEAVCQSTFSTGVLKVGSTQTSYSLEQEFTDLTKFRVFTGVVLDSIAIETTTDNYVTGSINFMGKTTSAFSGTSVATAVTPVTTKNKFYHEGGTFLEGGIAVGVFTNLSFELKNNSVSNKALGVTGVRSITAGKFTVTGTVTALFESTTIYDKFMNDTDSTMDFTLVSGAETLQFVFPKVKYTQASIPVRGDGPITVDLSFSAIYDDTAATSITITRV
jgi:hypothetical protein